MLTPKSETDLAEMIRAANGPLAIQGGGTRGMTTEGAPLTTSNLTGVTLYEPGALTLVVQAGTPVSEIDALLAEQNQRLAFEPMDHRGLLGTTGDPTIGGVAAANVSGPRRIAVGAARDFALGVRFVDGAGNIIKNGGRVMKNVTGYDLVKLMCGAYGTLGVLTEVSLKVLPMPETETTVLVEAETADEAVRLMALALGSPYDVTGTAYDPASRRVSLRLEGFASSVDYRADALKSHLKSDGSTAPDSAAHWQGIRDVAPFHNVDGDVWRVSVKPTDGPTVISQASADGALMDWSGGLVWLRVPEGTDIRARLAGIEGYATLVRASEQTHARLGTFHPEPAPLEKLSQGLRGRFDPNGLFAPNRQAA